MKHMKLCDNLATFFDPEFFVLFHAFHGKKTAVKLQLNLPVYVVLFLSLHSRFSLRLCVLCVKKLAPKSILSR